MFGFVGDLHSINIDWLFLSYAGTASLVGIVLAKPIAKHIEKNELKKYFGYFTLMMGASLLFKELFN